MTDRLKEWLWNRINRQNKNLIIVITGSTGSGKSFSALRLAELLDPSFNVGRVCFTPREVLAVLNSGLKKGNFFIIDEAGVTLPSRDFMSFANKALDFVLQTFRRENLGCILCLPTMSMLDLQARQLTHVLIETKEIMPKLSKVKVRVFMLTTNSRTGKVYYKYPKVMTPQGIRYTIDEVLIGKPSEQLIEAYEEKKKELEKKGGNAKHFVEEFVEGELDA